MTFDMNDPAEVDRFLTYCSEEVGMEQLLDRDVIGMLIQLAARGNDSGPWFSSVVHECCEKATIQQDRADALEALVADGIEAFRFTKEYLNVPDENGFVTLPDIEGWSHFDWTQRARAALAEEGA